MRYQAYRARMMKLVVFLRGVYARRKLILITLACILVTLAALTAVTGTVYGETDVPGTLYYGDTVSYAAKGVMSRASCEYGQVGDDGTVTDWSGTVPRFPGRYAARAVSRGLFGIVHESDVHYFDILPRPLTLSAAGDGLVWGDTPALSADGLADGDRMAAYAFVRGTVTDTDAVYVPDTASLCIRNGQGDDVTRAYAVTSAEKTLTVLPRPVTVTVSDASFPYDGTRITYDGYELTDGSLADGETLTAVFDAGLTLPGEVENTPALRVINAAGADMTAHYDITTVSGTLTVTKRPLVVTTESAFFYYDRQPHTVSGCTVSEDTPLLPGHTLTGEWITVTDNGTVNEPVLSVLDGDGGDVTALYAVFIDPGMITVGLRPLIVTTESADIVYDGETHTYEDLTVGEDSRLMAGHTVSGAAWLSVQYAGEAENRVTVVVTDENGADVTWQYSVTLNPGTLTVRQRPITVEFPDETVEYDGQAHSLTQYTVTSEPGLVPGDKLLCLGMPSLTYPNSRAYAPTDPELRITGAGGRNVTENYDITVIVGTLTVTKRRLVIRTDDAEFVYNGKAHRQQTYIFADGTELLPRRRLDISYPSVTNVGSVENAPSAELRIYEIPEDISQAACNETDYYDITVIPGTLTVTPRPVTLIVPDETKVYDGEPLKERVEVSPDSPYTLAAGEHIDSYSIMFSDGFMAAYEELEREQALSGGRDALTILMSNVGRRVSLPDADGIVIRNTFGEDTTGNYTFECLPGTLTVTRRTVYLYVPDETKFYDGEPLYPRLEVRPDSEYQMAPGDGLEETGFLTDAAGTAVYEKLKSDIERVIQASGVKLDAEDVLLSEVGSRIMRPATVAARNEWGEDTTDNYLFEYKVGTLTVIPRPISLISASAEKQYDGTPLTDARITASDGSLSSVCAGHTVIADVTGSRTEVGSSKNTYTRNTVRILTDYGWDVTHNYEIEEYLTGTLTVKPGEPVVSLTVYSTSDTKRYDGRALRNGGWTYTVTEGALPDGWHPVVSVTGRRTDIGVSENTLSCTVADENGKDVSLYCSIECKPGTLEVKPAAAILVLTDSAAKLYDGKPLTASGYEVKMLAGALPAGCSVSVTVTGSRTSVGTSNNTADVRVYAMFFDADITDQFEIVVQPGALTVYDAQHDDDDTLFGYVTATVSGRLYLRQRVWGDYTGGGWRAAVPYSVTETGGVNPDSFTALSLERAGNTGLARAHFTDVSLTVLTPYFSLPSPASPYGSTDTGVQIVLSDYDYNFCPFDADTDWNALPGVPDEYRAAESEYSFFAYEYYTSVDLETRAFLEENFIRPNGLSASDPDIINNVAEIIKISAVYNLSYNPKLDTEPNTVIAFLSDYREGVCRHYAAAATLLFRALGIPARYVEGFTVTCTAGETAEIRNPGHAWVEVYLCGIGWIPVEVTGSSAADSVLEVTLKPRYVYKEYDGQPLYSDGILDRRGALADLLDAGYTYSVRIDGAQRNVGTGTSTVAEFRLYDPDGNDVTDSGQFRFVTEPGVLRVTTAQVRIFLYQLSKYYDGNPLYYTDDDWVVLSAPAGITFRVSVNISMTEPGQLTLSDINADLDRYLTVTLYRDGRDVTDEYTVVVTVPDYMDEAAYIPIEVKPRPIELRAASVTRIDNGTPLSDPTVTITKGQLVAGDILQAEAVGELTVPGTMPNVINTLRLYIFNAVGYDVAYCYDITCVDGLLTLLDSVAG